jgi:hypothetical protein
VAVQVPAIGGDRQACIRRVLDALVEERARLRRAGADGALLEASRLAIAYWHQELSGRSRQSRRTPHEPSRSGLSGPWPGRAADRASTTAGGEGCGIYPPAGNRAARVTGRVPGHASKCGDPHL